jgi:hypothetical protein
MAANRGKLELALWWMKFDEVSSYRFVVMRGAHLGQFWGVGGDDLGWRQLRFPSSGGSW